MEPLTTISYVLTSFFVYYILEGISNNNYLRYEFQEINNNLRSINRQLQVRQ